MPDPEPVVTTVDLLRHGEPVGGRRYRGQIDDPLSETGWEQMQSAIADNERWDHIISSPLLRCRAFAESLAQTREIPLSIEANFAEVGFGAWEGLTRADIENRWPGALDRFAADPLGQRPQDAEPLEAFIERVNSTWQALLERFSGQHVLLVGHAGTIRVITGLVIELPPTALYRLQTDYAGRSRIRIESPGRTLLVYHNCRPGDPR